MYAAAPAFHSLGIRANARVRFPRAKTAPGGQTKPNGCIVFLVLVSCSGQWRCDAGVWGFRCVSTEWASLSDQWCTCLLFLRLFLFLAQRAVVTCENYLARCYAIASLQSSIHTPWQSLELFSRDELLLLFQNIFPYVMFWWWCRAMSDMSLQNFP